MVKSGVKFESASHRPAIALLVHASARAPCVFNALMRLIAPMCSFTRAPPLTKLNSLPDPIHIAKLV